MNYRYFLYCRRSTDEEKQALSIDSQKDELERRFVDLEIVEVLTEDASAFKPYNRPIFQKMLERISNGEADGIIAWHPDRISRNPLDGAQVIHSLDQGIIKDLKFASYTFENTPEGKMFLGFTLNQSKYFSDKLGKDVMRGLEKKCRMGHYPAKAWLGYRNVRTEEKGSRYIEEDEVRFPLVRKMWDMLLTGAYTVPDIHKKAVEEWGLTMSATRKHPVRPPCLATVYAIFTSIFYTGHFEWNGKRYKGSYKPMITLAEFDKAQQILGRRGKYRTVTHSFAFTGFMHCGDCDSMITAELKQKRLKKSGKLATYIYYRCVGKKGPCSQRGCIREEKLIEQLRPIVESISVSPRLAAWVKSKLHNLTEKDQRDQEKHRKELHRQYENAVKAMQNLVNLYVSVENGDKSLLSDEEFKAQKKALTAQRDRFKQLIDEADRNVDVSIKRTIEAFDFASNALRWFDEGDTGTRRMILVKIGQNWNLFDKTVHYDAKFAYKHIQRGNAKLAELSSRLEPENTSLTVEKSVSKEESLVWCHGLELNQRPRAYESRALTN